MDAITGKTAKRQLNLTREAQAEQARLLAEQRSNIEKVEMGQAQLRRGGGGGLLAFIDKRVVDEELKKTLGGGGASV